MNKILLGFCSALIMLAFLAQVSATTYSFPVIECVNNEHFALDDFWQCTNSTGADASYSYIDTTNGIWKSQCNESTGDEWGDALAYQGWIVHTPTYARNETDGKMYSMRSYPYIRVSDIEDEDKLLLKAKVKHSAPIVTSTEEWAYKAKCPTTGACVMLYWNVWVDDLGGRWLFNYTESDPWNDHNGYISEIFFSRFEYDGVWHAWLSVPAGAWWHNGFRDLTTHDNDLHNICLNFSMDNSNQWYEFEYDVGNLLYVDAQNDIEEHYYWGSEHNRNFNILGFQLMGIGLGNEVISSKWDVEFDYVKLQDNRNLTRNCEEYGFSAKTQYNVGTYYRPTYACGANVTYNMTSFKIAKVSTSGNSSCDGDLNYDGIVDIYDIALISAHWGENEGDDGWTYSADITPDKTIDIFDLTLISIHYGKTCEWTTLLGMPIYAEFLFNDTDYLHSQVMCLSDNLIDMPICTNGSMPYGASGLGSIKFYANCASNGTLLYPKAVVVKFMQNKDPSGTLDGSRMWSAIHECNYPYS